MGSLVEGPGSGTSERSLSLPEAMASSMEPSATELKCPLSNATPDKVSGVDPARLLAIGRRLAQYLKRECIESEKSRASESIQMRPEHSLECLVEAFRGWE